MREYFKNAAETAINDAGGIDNSVTSFDVANAALLPATPQFRILVDNEIMLVTNVSSNTLTVTRGVESTTPASHDDGAAVAHVVTLAGLEQLLRDWGNPLHNHASGIPQQLLDSSGATLDSTDFTNINFTNASKTDDSTGAIVLAHNTQGAANDVAMIVKSAPSTPWVITVAFIPNCLNNNGSFIGTGPVIRDSSTGEFYFFQFRVEDPNAGSGRWGNRVMVQTYDNPTTTNTIVLTQTNWSGPFGAVWMRIEDDGTTNLTFRLSADGINWITLGTQARTGFLTPDQVGFGINNFNNGTTQAIATIVAWDEA